MGKLANFMKKWDGRGFESSCYETDEFKSFAASFKRALNGDLKETGMELVSFTKGHFFISGFLRTSGGRHVYFSVSDVRFPSANLKQILYRTAKDEHDYTGGSNHYCSLDKLLSSAEWLAERAA